MTSDQFSYCLVHREYYWVCTIVYSWFDHQLDWNSFDSTNDYIGIAGGSSFIIPLHICFTYNRDHHKMRSSYIKYVGVSIDIIGLGIGPLLGSAVTEIICNRVRFKQWTRTPHRDGMEFRVNEREHRTGNCQWLYLFVIAKAILVLTFFMVEPSSAYVYPFLRLACRRVIFTIAYQ